MRTKCPHGYQSPKSCIDCMYDDGVDKPKTDPVPETLFNAGFDGFCAAKCGDPIEKGNPIYKMSDGTYRHLDCVKVH